MNGTETDCFTATIFGSQGHIGQVGQGEGVVAGRRERRRHGPGGGGPVGGPLPAGQLGEGEGERPGTQADARGLPQVRALLEGEGKHERTPNRSTRKGNNYSVFSILLCHDVDNTSAVTSQGIIDK